MSLYSAWLEPPDITISDELRAAVGGHPLVAETLARRGITSAEAARAFLDPACYSPAAAGELPGMDSAVRRLEVAIRRREAICVWGDFDVDGQTATATLVETLRGLGGKVSYHVPVRANESHGVNVGVLQRLIDEGAHLLLTCDTGIGSHEAIAYAHSRGVDVIVTDHHALPAELPAAAYAIVNPQLLPAAHPLRTLPGVGVAYKLAEALCGRAGQPALAERGLDLVALGIVADVATQTGDTRYLLQRGLAALRTTARAGLLAIYEANALDPARLTEEHIGFVIGPRLNALGRLADANLAVELLTTDDVAQARILAGQLETLNAQRKLMCDQVYAAAEAQIKHDPALLESAALVLAHPRWPAGVIGIVAGRLAERYGRPAVLIACPPGEPARGSARSVAGCDITAAIGTVAEDTPGLLLGYGGHPMAAGLSIEAERIPEFRRALARTAAAMLGPSPEPAALRLDGEMPLDALSLELVDDLERLAPFGPGNPPLVLMARGIHVESSRAVGRGGEHLLVKVGTGDQGLVTGDQGPGMIDQEDGEPGDEGDGGSLSPSYKVIWWQAGDGGLPQGRFDLAYSVRASDYRGQREVQVEWIAARPMEGAAGDEMAAPADGAHQPTCEVVDFRGMEAPGRLLADLRDEGELLVWCEGPARSELGGRHRLALARAERLAVWTVPPGNAEWRAVLDVVRPAHVYLFGADDAATTANAFLERLAGLVKYALRSTGGRAGIAALAAACAQREATVRVGLDWLAARGFVVVQPGADGEVLLAEGVPAGTPGAGLPALTARLQALLAETAAYRAHFMRAAAESLIA
jgi:single-stranded-DNA-specific exonuclease